MGGRERRGVGVYVCVCVCVCVISLVTAAALTNRDGTAGRVCGRPF